MEDIKRIEQEPLVTNEKALEIAKALTAVRKEGVGATHNDLYTAAIRHARDIYESARSKDTDLISFVKDWAEKRGHAFHCAITQHPVVGGVYHKGCTCGLSEVLQRINDRSK